MFVVVTELKTPQALVNNNNIKFNIKKILGTLWLNNLKHFLAVNANKFNIEVNILNTGIYLHN